LQAPRSLRSAARAAAPLIAFLAGAGALSAQAPSVSYGAELERLASATVSPSGAAWAIDLTMLADNADASLPSSFRRWWACTISGWNSASAQTFNLRVLNAGYTDVILPVWRLRSVGSASFGPWQRVPLSALPTVSGSTHRFTLPVPAGTSALQLAKFFPFGVSDKDAWLAQVQANAGPRLRRVQNLGASLLGRAIELLEVSDPATPDRFKRRAWIHSGIHPSESTSYFAVQGLLEFLLSSDSRARVLLADAIVDVVPMANPDGVFLGNYRTNAASINLEEQWAAPYGSAVPEIVALRTAIEQRMGTPASPGANPIEVLLNLHSSHNVTYPFHFRHSANASFDLVANRSGVIPSVNALETRWIDALRARSPFASLGTTQSSSCGSPTRPFVECMCHDRWTIQPGWPAPVMAITLEGTYARGPVGTSWSTPDDYRQLGREMGLALVDHLGLLPGLFAEPQTSGCVGSPSLNARAFGPSLSRSIELRSAGLTPGGLGALVLGNTPLGLTLPPFGCTLDRVPDLSFAVVADAQGEVRLAFPYPPLPAFTLDAQLLHLRDLAGSPAFFTSPLQRLHLVPAY
jgi:hypothetical protein